MKFYNYFFPDYSELSGLGHFYRCLKYSRFIKKGKIIFLYTKRFNPELIKILKKNNIGLLKFNKSFFKKKKKLNTTNIITIDSYCKKSIFFKKNIFDKVILISDKKPLIINPDIIIDHTFGRRQNFYLKEKKKKIKCFVGINYFPFEIIKKNNYKKQIILINYGGVYDVDLINKSLEVIKKLNFNKKILIISNNFTKKMIKKDYINFKIQIVKLMINLNDVYKKTYLSFGSCGISFYEKLFYKIPTICTPVAGNQMNNYKNFSNSNLIIKLNELSKINNQKILKDLNLLRKRLIDFTKTIDKKKIIDIMNLYEKKN